MHVRVGQPIELPPGKEQLEMYTERMLIALVSVTS